MPAPGDPLFATGVASAEADGDELLPVLQPTKTTLRSVATIAVAEARVIEIIAFIVRIRLVARARCQGRAGENDELSRESSGGSQQIYPSDSVTAIRLIKWGTCEEC